MKRVIKRKQIKKQLKKQLKKQSKKQLRNDKSLKKKKLKRKVKRIKNTRKGSKKPTILRSQLKSKKFNSRIKSIYKKSLKKKQRGGNTSKCGTSNNSSFIFGKDKGNITNTIDNINNVGGQILTDSYLGAENSIGNFYNNVIGEPEVISPSVTVQPISN